MSEIPEALVEKAAQRIEDHAYGHRISNSPYGHVCPSECLAHAVLAAVLPDARRVALDDLLQRADDGIEFGPENYSLLVRMVRTVREATP